MQLVAAAAAFWGGLLWGRVGSGPVVLVTAAVLGLAATRRSTVGSAAAMGCAFLLGGLLVQEEAEVRVEPGLARIVVDTFRTTCGERGSLGVDNFLGASRQMLDVRSPIVDVRHTSPHASVIGLKPLAQRSPL